MKINKVAKQNFSAVKGGLITPALPGELKFSNFASSWEKTPGYLRM